MEVVKDEIAAEPEIIYKGNLAYYISINQETKTYDLTFDGDEAASVPCNFAMMILMREKIKHLVTQERVNELLVRQNKMNPKLVMSKTMFNKHVHFVELLDKYIAEVTVALRGLHKFPESTTPLDPNDSISPREIDTSEGLPIS